MITRIVIGLVLLVLGLLMLHYVDPEDVGHHQEWAKEHGMPAPDETILILGAAATTIGGAIVGWAIGRRRAASRPLGA